jgi:hypothetical protein
MRNVFAKTSNVDKFHTGITLVQTRGASEASWLATIGEPGFGKTKTMQWWAVQNKAVYLRAKANWRPHWLLSELVGELTGAETSGSTKTLFGIALRELARRQCAVVVDEAWNMLHDSRLLETLRDLSDLVENVVVLGGEKRVTDRLTQRFPQISSRISEIVQFAPASVKDVRIMCDALAEVPISDDLVEAIHKASGGYYREIKNAIARAETFGKRHAGKQVAAKDVAGQELCRDRLGGLPTVR